METLWSGANLFIKYPSVDYKWPFNMKHSHISASTAAKSFSKSFMFFPCVRLCFHAWSHTCIINVVVESVWTKNGASNVWWKK